MKKFYHICLTAHSEVLLRGPDDVIFITNYIALAAFRTDTQILVDSIMSTHIHLCVLTEDPYRFARSLAGSLAKGFNTRHTRRGALFDGKPFILQIQGPQHMQMALNYTLRQGLHHAQSETAFSYPWSTCNCIFTADRGVCSTSSGGIRPSGIEEFFPKNATIPEYWETGPDGMLLRKSFEQIPLVEQWYGTARNYIFSMIRKTSDEWLAGQDRDGPQCQKVTLGLLEAGYTAEQISRMLENEGSTKLIQKERSDMDLCRLIDGSILGRYKAASVYDLTAKKKSAIADELRRDLGIHSEKQISRCLAMRYL